jgi:hypothetical protein
MTLKKLIQEITKLVEQDKVRNPEEPETLSKIYQKNYLIKEVDSVIKECKKIQVLIKSNNMSTMVKRIMLLGPNIQEK